MASKTSNVLLIASGVIDALELIVVLNLFSATVDVLTAAGSEGSSDFTSSA